MIAEAQKNVDLSTQLVLDIDAALKALSDGHVSEDDYTLVDEAMKVLEVFHIADWEMGITDELISGGALDLVRDTGLRQSLIEQRDNVEGKKDQQLNIRLTMTEYVPLVHRYVRFGLDADITDEHGLNIIITDRYYDELAADRNALNALSLILRAQGYNRRDHQRVLAEALAIETQLEKLASN